MLRNKILCHNIYYKAKLNCKDEKNDKSNNYLREEVKKIF